MKQMPLPYGGTPPFEKTSDTSLQAAVSVSRSAGRMRSQVLGWIASRSLLGSTDDEVEVALEMRHQTASARRRELELMGLVIKAGARRKTRSGRTAEVYIIDTQAMKP